MSAASSLLVASQAGVLVVFGLFAVLYHVLSPWWRYPYGRLVMALALGIVSFAASGLASLVWPDYPGRSGVLVWLRIALIGVGGWQICQLVMAQAYGELRRRKPPEESGTDVH